MRTGHTGRAAPALIYSMHRALVVWIIVAHFRLCNLLGMLLRYTVLGVLGIIRPCIQHTVGAASMASAWFIYWPMRPVRGLYGPDGARAVRRLSRHLLA